MDIIILPRDSAPSREEYVLMMRARILGFDKFAKARVGIAGTGGLGSNVAMMLARSGIGYLKLVDRDRVDATNIARQYFDNDDIGKPKADALKDRLGRINPYMEIDAVNMVLAQSN